MHDHQRRSVPDDLVIDQDTMRVHEAFFHAIDIRVLRRRSRLGRFRLGERSHIAEREQQNEMGKFHAADYSFGAQGWLQLSIQRVKSDQIFADSLRVRHNDEVR